jgi:LCP family protein required for cell wall assembly
MRAAAWISVALTAVLVSGVLAAYAKYRAVWDSIGKIALTDLGHRPPKYTHAVNILVFGYDTRTGLTRRQQFYWHVGHTQGTNTDTIMLVHLSPGRHRVTVLSFPRDTMVPVYQCDSGKLPDGTAYSGQAAAPGSVVQINALYQIGGPSCLVKTIEQQTGIYIDHFVALGFAGFVHAINDIGGVIVCSPVVINDSVSGLRLKEGYQRVFGVTALKLWRTRENLGLGTDTQRIMRNQFFMAQMLKSVERNGLLASPTKLWHVVSDLTSQMLIDAGLTPTDLLHIVASLKGVGNGHVQLIPAPWEFDPTNQNRVILLQPQADTVFAAIAHDRRLPKVSAAKGRHGRKGIPVPTVSPTQVNVAVLNGSGVAGIAGKAAGGLTNLGFKAAVSPVNGGNAPNYHYTKSVIEYSTRSELPAVNTLKAQLGNVTIRKVAGLTAGTLDLIIGHSYTGLTGASSGKKGPSIGSLAGTYGGITAASGMCSAASKNAFTGPGTVNG